MEWTKAFRLLFGPKEGPQTLEEHIKALGKAILRTRRRMDEIEAKFRFPADCCPMCACGPEWNALVDKLMRQAFWLEKLRKKQERKQ